jgi:hypothetical protein
MRKFAVTFTVLLAAAFLIPENLTAQDCRFFYPSEVGSVLEYTFYNKKGREESYQSQKVVNKTMDKGATVVTIEAINTTGKKDEEFKSTFDVKCDNGKFFINMQDFASSVNYEQYEGSPDLDVVVNSDDLFYPSDMEVGQTLPDGKIEISVLANGVRMFGSDITIKDRKVEAMETIETPAGSFECLKVTSTVVTKSMMTMETQTIQWLAEDVGVVKTENLSKKGKLVGYQLLTGMSK